MQKNFLCDLCEYAGYQSGDILTLKFEHKKFSKITKLTCKITKFSIIS